MNKLILLGIAATLGAARLAFFPANPPVELQPTSPGTAQAGHLNISGTAVVGQLKSNNTVFGQSTAPTGFAYGGFFTAASNQARGFYGYASSPTGLTYGGFFQNASDQGRAVYGLATATSGNSFGGYFQTASSSGRGVQGVAASPTGTTYGIYGSAVSPTGYGVFSNGNMSATGVISGNGSGLTNLDAGQLALGTVPVSRIPNPLSLVGSQSGSFVIKGTNDSSGNDSSGVSGLASAGTGSTAGGSFQSDSTAGTGVFGLAFAPSGATFGGYFQSNSVAGTGVAGTSAGTVGVSGTSTATSNPAYGGRFSSLSTAGRGVFGSASSATGVTYGGYFQSASTTGRAVFGDATNATGFTYGGYFQAASSSGRAVLGDALNATGNTRGGDFRSASNMGVGVSGYASSVSGETYGGSFANESSSGTGVYGHATNTGAAVTVYGVSGRASTATFGFGVYAYGDLGASGTKSFRIDHPSDPENKYLLHYSSESPFPQNFYNGNVHTDSRGYAWVQLPDYFNDINANYKYVLTVVDDADSDGFVQAKVSKKISGNRFQVRTSSPNVEVSWMVFADRNDERIRFNRPTDVRVKSEAERGKYQHPEYYGLGEARGIGFGPPDEMKVRRSASNPR